MTKILTSHPLAEKLQARIQAHVARRQAAKLRPPGLAVIQVGNDASTLYVRKKRALCESLGMRSFHFDLPQQTSEETLIQQLQELNQHPEVDGILIQLPLPDHLDSKRILSQIAPEKDVDGMHPLTLGRLAQNIPTFQPCTPQGILWLLAHYKYTLEQKHVVLIGMSNIIGKPLVLTLMQSPCTLTLCHNKTTQAQLKQAVTSADILVVATGQRGVIDPTWVKSDTIVVDVGIHRLEDGTVVGDCDFEALKNRVRAITPVPGGVGPMTLTALMFNTLWAAEQQNPCHAVDLHEILQVV
jgi:methylenetetrahydrofolate dehydrogenase (NADP+)/methenyltetrahydrofolate cyclohydrolase